MLWPATAGTLSYSDLAEFNQVVVHYDQRPARTEPLTVTIHDAAGRVVRTLVHGALLDAGETSIPCDGRDDAGGEVRSGVYFCHIRAQSGARTIPIILRR